MNRLFPRTLKSLAQANWTTPQFGGALTVGHKPINSETVQVFRKSLAELAKRAQGQAFVTDKMPQNFRYIALICAALPEAKIIHVREIQKLHAGQTSNTTFLQKALDTLTILVI